MIQVTLLDTVELATYTVRTFALYKVRRWPGCLCSGAVVGHFCCCPVLQGAAWPTGRDHRPCLAWPSVWVVRRWAISHGWGAVGDRLQVVHLATAGFWPGHLMLSCRHSDPVMDPRAGPCLPLASVHVTAVLPLEGQHGKP